MSLQLAVGGGNIHKFFYTLIFKSEYCHNRYLSYICIEYEKGNMEQIGNWKNHRIFIILFTLLSISAFGKAKADNKYILIINSYTESTP